MDKLTDASSGEEEKKSFVLYNDLRNVIQHLDNELRGQVFMAILDYVNGDAPDLDNVTVKVAFEPIRQGLDRNAIKYGEAKKKRSIAGREGNLSRWDKDIYERFKNGEMTLEEAETMAKTRRASHSDPNGSASIASIAGNVNVPVNVPVPENENENENENASASEVESINTQNTRIPNQVKEEKKGEPQSSEVDPRERESPSFKLTPISASNKNGHEEKIDFEALKIKKSLEFYDNEMKKFKGQGGIIAYREFVDYLKGDNPSGSEYANILALPKQLDFEMFFLIEERALENDETIFSMLDSLDNRRGCSSNISLGTVLLNWINSSAKEKDEEYEPEPIPKPESKPESKPEYKAIIDDDFDLPF